MSSLASFSTLSRSLPQIDNAPVPRKDVNKIIDDQLVKLENIYDANDCFSSLFPGTSSTNNANLIETKLVNPGFEELAKKYAGNGKWFWYDNSINGRTAWSKLPKDITISALKVLGSDGHGIKVFPKKITEKPPEGMTSQSAKLFI